jgi:NADP-dependent 3-hydroxy acid dehydrogenase YdfG
VFVADVTKQPEVDALAAFLSDLGPVHALVNNAGGAWGGLTSAEHGDPADWQRMFDVNVLGTKRVTSAVLPLLRASWMPGTSADILTITSTAGHTVYDGGGGYNAAKFAEHALVGLLRLELAGEPIRVMELAPGLVKTDEFSVKRFDGDTAKAQAVYDNVPDPLYAEDIALAIVTALELPHHINLDVVTIRPVAQAAVYKLIRGELKPKD